MFFKKKKNVSSVGRLVDQPMKDFKRELKAQHINVGTMNNMIHLLTSVYADLRTRKDTLIKAYMEEKEPISKRERNKIAKAISNIYVELIKVEEQIIFLQNEVERLVDVGQIDSSK